MNTQHKEEIMRPFKHAAILVVLSFTVWAQQEAVREAQVELKAKPAMREAQVEPKAKPAMRETQVELQGKTTVKTAADVKEANAIFEEQKKKLGCSLTAEEMRTIAEKHLQANPIVFNSPKDPTRHGRIILEALHKLDGKVENADKVFEEMELEKKGVSKRQWERFSKTPMPEQQLKDMEAHIPKTQEELDKTALQMQVFMKGHMESGLLAYRILLEYNKKHKDNPINDKTMFDWGVEAYKLKEKAFMDWWSEKLTQKYPDAQKRETICAILSRNTGMGLSALTGAGSDWLPFFQEKIMKWNINQKVED